MKNDPFAVAIVCWESRNWHHLKKSVEWSKNYGLTPFARNVYLGRLKEKERATLFTKFQKTFINDTERFYIVPICKSCYDKAVFHKTDKMAVNYPAFEIVQ